MTVKIERKYSFPQNQEEENSNFMETINFLESRDIPYQVIVSPDIDKEYDNTNIVSNPPEIIEITKTALENINKLHKQYKLNMPNIVVFEKNDAFSRDESFFFANSNSLYLEKNQLNSLSREGKEALITRILYGAIQEIRGIVVLTAVGDEKNENEREAVRQTNHDLRKASICEADRAAALILGDKGMLELLQLEESKDTNTHSRDNEKPSMEDRIKAIKELAENSNLGLSGGRFDGECNFTSVGDISSPPTPSSSPTNHQDKGSKTRIEGR